MNATEAAGITVVGVSIALRTVDWFWHRDPRPTLSKIGLITPPAGARRRAERAREPVAAVVPFAIGWCDIAAALLLTRLLPAMVGLPLLALVAAARFRFLQEVGHTALHGALSGSRRWQWLLADLFANGPLFRPDSAHRFTAHVRQHHRHVNQVDGDPNIARFIRTGFVPGLTTRRFAVKLVHPLTPAGLLETITAMAANLRLNRSVAVAAVRAASVAAAVTLFALLGGVEGVLAGYVVPLLTLYPLFSWISLLVEHRWFLPERPANRRIRECTLGRPTAYPGPLGRLLSWAMFPASDRWHLAHSLYPGVRWNYLPAIDRTLRRLDPDYVAYASVGLLRPRPPYPSALSDLRQRMTAPGAADRWVASTARPAGWSTRTRHPVDTKVKAHVAAGS